jgi:hypothetical protein
MSSIMRAILQDHAPNTYYGHWLPKNALKQAAKLEAIARNEVVASAGVATFDGSERDIRANRSPARRKFVYGPKRKSNATAL